MLAFVIKKKIIINIGIYMYIVKNKTKKIKDNLRF